MKKRILFWFYAIIWTLLHLMAFPLDMTRDLLHAQARKNIYWKGKK